MLSALRAATRSVAAKILLFLLVISFAIWGASGAFIGGAGSSTVEFGDTRVDMLDYRLAYDLQANAVSRQLGQRITREQARAFGIEQSVLAQVIAGAVMDENARRMGLGISTDRLAGLIAADPTFQDGSGRFSRAALQAVLRQVGMREEDYVRNRKAVAVRRQFLDAVAAGVEAPKAFADAFSVYEGQKRVFEFVEVGPSAITETPRPTDADIEDYYEANKGQFVAPEYRRLTIVRLTAEDIARPDLVDEDAVAAAYETRKSTYTTPQKRRVQQIVFKDRAEAQAALDRIRAGETFDAIIAESGRSAADVDLGLVSEKEIPDVAVAEAAFALPLNETSEVVAGIFGPVLLRAVEIQAESVKPLTEVADGIRAALAQEKATDELFDVHDRLEDERAAGETLSDAARKVGLTPRVIEQVDRQGNAPDGTPVADIPEAATLLAGAFETDPDVETDPIAIAASGFVWYAVEAITPERQKPLEEVRDAVVAGWADAEIAARLGELAETVRDRVAKGETLAAVAAELLPAGGEEVPPAPTTSAEMTRSDTTEALTRTAVSAGFSVAQGDVVVAPGAKAPARLVLRVVKVVEAEPRPVADNVRERVGQSIADQILDAMVADFQSRGEVRVNQRAIEAALGS